MSISQGILKLNYVLRIENRERVIYVFADLCIAARKEVS